jgi:hypothetical protein
LLALRAIEYPGHLDSHHLASPFGDDGVAPEAMVLGDAFAAADNAESAH